MIQYWIKDQIVAAMPGVAVTVDYQPNSKEHVTIFYENGGSPGRFEIPTDAPRYMIWVQSPDFGYAEYLAERIKDLLHQIHHRRGTRDIAVEYYRKNVLHTTEMVELQKLSVENGPNRIGVEDGAMQYTVNLLAIITQKEDNQP